MLAWFAWLPVSWGASPLGNAGVGAADVDICGTCRSVIAYGVLRNIPVAPLRGFGARSRSNHQA